MKFIISVLLTAFVLGFAGTSYADSCASVKREMIYGQTALKKASSKHGYLKSAKEFEEAVKKAPDCAAAHFNLGLVYDKAEEYKLALQAFRSYLKLSPNAADKSTVEDKIYELEYQIKDAEQTIDITGLWRNIKPGDPKRCSDYVFKFKKSDSSYVASLYMPSDLNSSCERYKNPFSAFNLNVNGLAVSGSITQDLSTWANAPPRSSWTKNIAGSISEDGSRMRLQFQWTFPNGATGNMANGWGSYSDTLNLERQP